MKTKILILALIFINIKNAYAYLDPGTGSIILQGLIAGILSVSVAISSFRQKIINFIKLLKRKVGKDKKNEE
jgi:hypothetical protein